MSALTDLLIGLPERLSRPLAWLPPLIARIVVGWVFMWTGWAKLNNLPLMIENFTEWGIPAPQIMTPFVSGVEFIGGILLLVGLFTRIAAAPLAIVMLVAIYAAKWADIDSLETLLGFEEVAYFTIFTWLAIAGPGAVSLDHLLRRSERADSSLQHA